MEKNNDALFYTRSLIEYIGRITVNHRSDIIDQLGKETVARIYEYADVFHCEPIEKVANDFIEEYEIKNGEFDNVTACKISPGNILLCVMRREKSLIKKKERM